MNVKYVIILQLISILFLSCSSFAYKKKISENYYIIGVDSRSFLSIDRKTMDGNFIGRVPENVLEYGIKDSFIVAKSSSQSYIQYYILNMKKDSDFAEEKEYLIGPLTNKEFKENWQTRLDITLKKSQ